MIKNILILYKSLCVVVVVFIAQLVFAVENRPPEVTPIKAELIPPETHFSVKATDPDGDHLFYKWKPEIECGQFSAPIGEAFAAWSHPDYGKNACLHEEGVAHKGTITVVVDDGKGGNEVTCLYKDGSLDGVGPACKVTKTAPVEKKIEPKKIETTVKISLPQNSEIDTCVKLKKAEAETRSEFEKAKEQFEKINVLREKVFSAELKAKAAEAEYDKAAKVAGPRGEGEIWYSNGYSGTKTMWGHPGKNGELGKAADVAEAKRDAARKEADSAKQAFDQSGGETAWQIAKTNYDSAFSSWDSARIKLAECLHQNLPKSIPPKTDDKKQITITPPPKIVDGSCKNGDTRVKSSEKLDLSMINVRQAKVVHDSNYIELEEEGTGFIEWIKTIKNFFFKAKTIKSYKDFDEDLRRVGKSIDIDYTNNIPIAGPLDHLDFYDFLTYYDKMGDEVITGLEKISKISKKLHEVGEYWLEYPIRDYVASCTVTEVCKTGKWQVQKSFDITRGKDPKWDKTNKETAVSADEAPQVVTRLFTMLQNKNKPNTEKLENFEKACLTK